MSSIQIYYRETAKISRQLLSAITGPIIGLKKEGLNSHARNYDLCPASCQFKSVNPETKNSLCSKACEFDIPKTKNTYVYENKEYKIKDTWVKHKFTKSQIRMIVFYHFLVEGSAGLISNLSDLFIATALDISTRTVREVNRVLVELGIISKYKGYPHSYYHIIIKDYQRYHLNKIQEQGIGGYLEFPVEFLREVILPKKERESVVYALRTFMSTTGGATNPIVSYKEINCYTSKGKQYTKAYMERMNSIKECVTYAVFGDGIKLYLRDAMNIRRLRPKKLGEIDVAVHLAAKENDIQLQEKDFEDCRQLGLEYGLDMFCFAVKSIFRLFKDTLSVGAPIGSVLRNHLQSIKINSRMMRRSSVVAS